METPPLEKPYKKAISLKTILIAICCILCTALTFIYYYAPVDRYLEKKLRAYLLEKGIKAEFTLAMLNTEKIRIENARLLNSTAFKFAEFELTYDLQELLNKGRIKAIRIDGLEIIISKREDGSIGVDGLEALTQGNKDNYTQETLFAKQQPFDLLLEDARIIYRHNKEMMADVRIEQAKIEKDYQMQITLPTASFFLDKENVFTASDIKIMRSDSSQNLNLSIATLAHNKTKKPWFSPVTLSGHFTAAKENGELEGKIDMHDMPEHWTAHIKMLINSETGNWKMDFEQPMTAFESGLFQPDMLFPILGGIVKQASGGIGLKTHMESGKDGASLMKSNGQIAFSDFSATVKDVPINHVNGTMHFSSLVPLATQGQQKLKVAEIVLGLPLREGMPGIELKKSGDVTLAPGSWKWANGELQMESIRTNLYKPQLSNVTLTAKQLSLEALLASLLQKGLSATGQLNGTLPVTFKNGKALIHEGVLSAEGGGIVKYIPDAESPLQKGGSMQTDMLLSALENFHYSDLSMRINNKNEEEVEVLLHVIGKNPELYGGQTIELNINLNGKLFEIIQSGMNLYTLPERLQEQLTQ